MKSEIKENIVLTSTIGLTVFITFFIISFIYINTVFSNSIYERFINHVKSVNIYDINNISPIITDDENNTYIPFFNESSIKADFTKNIFFNDFRNYDFYSKDKKITLTGYFNKNCEFVNNKTSSIKKLYLNIDNSRIKCVNNEIISDKLALKNSKIFGNGLISYTNISDKVRQIKIQTNYFISYILFDYLYHKNNYILEKFIKDIELKEDLLKNRLQDNNNYYHKINSIEDFSNYDTGKLYYKINYSIIKYSTGAFNEKKEIKRICKIKLEFSTVEKKNDLNLYVTSLSDTYNLIKKDKNTIISIINQNVYKIINGNISEKIKTLGAIIKFTEASQQKLGKRMKDKEFIIYLIKNTIGNENIVSVNSIIVDRLDSETEYIAKVSLTNQLNDNVRFEFYFKQINKNNFKLFYIEKE